MAPTQGLNHTYLSKSNKIGYGKTRAQVLHIVEEVAIRKGISMKKPVTDGWYRRFKKRAPKMTLRKGDPMLPFVLSAPVVRRMGTTSSCLRKLLMSMD